MSKVVISRLSCGLGNQLFQYAAACGVALAADARPVLDATSFVIGKEERSFALDRYDLGIPILTATCVDANWGSVTVAHDDDLRRLEKKEPLRLPLYRQDNYEFEPHIKSADGDMYLFGFWQSWKYFHEASRQVGEGLGRLRNPAAAAVAFVSDAARTDAVAVHVRRGDYLTPYNQGIFGLCEMPYYAAAMDLIRENYRHARFFVFSDDPDWCRANFTQPDVVVMSSREGDPRDDLYMMSHCRHHITANSSFSWWGAWLGGHPDSVVVAPVPWYTQSPQVPDLIPDHWIRLHRRTGARWFASEQDAGARTVSVIVLARSTIEALCRALASVEAQTHACSEVIVALAEPSLARDAADIGRRKTGCRLTIGSQRGAGAALNAAIAEARGDWIAFLDDGDTWLPTCLQTQLEIADLADRPVVTCRTTPVAGPDGLCEMFPPLGPPNCSLPKMIRAGNFISGISHTVARRSAVREAGTFEAAWTPEQSSAVMHDLHWTKRAVMHWTRLVFSPIPYMSKADPSHAAARAECV